MSENWRNNKYGTLQNSGKERAIDYGGGPDYFAPVRAVILMDEDENLLGDRDSPLFITGNVDTGNSEIFVTNDPLPITGGVFVTNNPVVITGDVFLTNNPMPITGDVHIVDDLDNIIGIRGSPIFITGAVTDDWNIAAISDTTPADSDKTFTVPLDREYQVLSIHVDYYAFADVANRQLQVDFRDTADNVFGEIRTGAIQTANTTGHYMVAPGSADLGAFRNTNYLMTPMPPTVFLQPGEDIRVYDNVLTANDTMAVRIRVAERAV